MCLEAALKIKSPEWNTQTDRMTDRPTLNFINIDMYNRFYKTRPSWSRKLYIDESFDFLIGI